MDRAWQAGHDLMTRTDEELVARSISGDVESFNQLVLRWERPIYALAYRVIGREEEARDVVQETFLRAFRGIKNFRKAVKPEEIDVTPRQGDSPSDSNPAKDGRK